MAEQDFKCSRTNSHQAYSYFTANYQNKKVPSILSVERGFKFRPSLSSLLFF